MSNLKITIGTLIEYPTVHNIIVKGYVEKILENTVLIRDNNKATHLILKSSIKNDGFSIDVDSPSLRRPYTKS